MCVFFFFKQKTAYEMRISDWSSDVCSSDLNDILRGVNEAGGFGYQNNIQPNQPSAGKTGTTNSANSVWFVGYTPTLAGASMIAGANADGSPSSLIGKSVRSEEHTSELQSLMRISHDVF